MYNLERFVEAQKRDYSTALNEIKSGRKRSHWIWYVFPQLEQLGRSSTAKYYGIRDIQEAQEYLMHPILGSRLDEICKALLALETDNPYNVMGTIDGVKLRSSMTLFSEASEANPVFDSVLKKFFDGEKDEITLNLLSKRGNY